MWAVCPLCLLAMSSQTRSINDHVSHLPPLYIEQSLTLTLTLTLTLKHVGQAAADNHCDRKILNFMHPFDQLGIPFLYQNHHAPPLLLKSYPLFSLC